MMRYDSIRHATRLARRLLADAPVALLAACDLEVTDPAIVDPNFTNTPAALPSLRAGALSDLKLAVSGSGGNTEGVIALMGMRADEFRNADTFDGRQQVDRGNVCIDGPEIETGFRKLQQARLTAEFAARKYAAQDSVNANLAEMLNVAGYTYIYLAENFCSGIPFSELDEETSAVTGGEALTREETLQRAIRKFDSALTVAGSATTGAAGLQRNLASVGKGRALQELGQYEQAAQAVEDVPTTFVYALEHSENSAGQNNGIYFLNNVNRRWTVSGSEGGVGLPFRSANDPRVPVANANRTGLDNRSAMWYQYKYPERKASIPMASGIEARLIEAEAALRRNDRATFLAKHNELRADRTLYRCPQVATPGYVCPDNPQLAPLALDGSESQDELAALHFYERGFWLFATGTRLADMRRMVRAEAQGGWGFAVEDVFPQGAYPKGGPPYENTVSLPIPADEKNNPFFADYQGCDVTVP